MGHEFGEKPSSPHIDNVIQLCRSGRVLDVGCGTGQNSVYLARQGYEVDALDNDSTALELLAKKATEANVGLRLINEDIATYQPDAEYDIILADRSLYFLPTYNAFKAAVIKLQDATTIGGVHSNTILSDYNKVDPGPRLVMGRYSMFNLYMNHPDWERRHEWTITDPLGQECVALISQKIH